MGLSKDTLVFDTTSASTIADSDQVGAFLFGAGGNLVTSTTVGSDEALDVNIVQATGLGIYAEDSAASSGEDGQSILAVRQDSLASSTSADGDYGWFKQNAKGELYIKATDSDALLATIDADTGNIAGDTSTIAGDTTSIDSILTALSKAEDAAHGSGDQGIQFLAVRNDVEGSLVDTDGDYAPLQVDSSGRLRVIGDLDVVGNVADDAADSGNPLKVGSRGVSGALTALSATNDRADLLSDLYRRVWMNNSPNIASKLSAPAITTSAVEIASTPQAGRTRILVQNLSNLDLFVGPDNTVTVATGIRIGKGATMELPYGPDLNLWGIGDTGFVADVRVLEVA